MKKTVSSVLALCIVLYVMVFVTSASAVPSVTFYSREKNTSDSSETEYQERMKRIADYVSWEISPGTVLTSGSKCTLFGHDLTSSVVMVDKSTTVPGEVVEETYIVKTCSRCGYMKKELLSSIKKYY